MSTGEESWEARPNPTPALDGEVGQGLKHQIEGEVKFPL